MIRIRQLEALCAVIEVGTTSGAADVLSISQPAVSNMLRHMEDVAGFPLFLREKGRLVPTPEARHIAKEAQHLFAQRNRIDRTMQQLRGGTVGRLDLIATPSIGYGLLPRLVTAFTATRPEINLSIEVGSVDDISQRLTSGQADLGFSITSPRYPALDVRPIADGEMVCAMPPDHAYAQMQDVDIVDLNLTRHISYNESTPLGQMIDSIFSTHGIERRYICEVRHTATALEIVAAGGGVALVDSFGLLGRRREDIVVRPVRPRLPISLHSVTSGLFPTSQIGLQFNDFVQGELRASTAVRTPNSRSL